MASFETMVDTIVKQMQDQIYSDIQETIDFLIGLPDYETVISNIQRISNLELLKFNSNFIISDEQKRTLELLKEMI